MKERNQMALGLAIPFLFGVLLSYLILFGPVNWGEWAGVTWQKGNAGPFKEMYFCEPEKGMRLVVRTPPEEAGDWVYAAISISETGEFFAEIIDCGNKPCKSICENTILYKKGANSEIKIYENVTRDPGHPHFRNDLPPDLLYKYKEEMKKLPWEIRRRFHYMYGIGENKRG
ncbi:MAG: hypothetical protein HY764_04390 [Candidatus Portnoybacteria bacterium]|nr:hypothetical protein [Candidatus Portnoybacteria bacterium]